MPKMNIHQIGYLAIKSLNKEYPLFVYQRDPTQK